MKAVTFQGPLKLEIKEVEDPSVQEPNDIILKITSTAICGSDLHAYDGRMPMPPTGWTIGHEYVGEVVEVGSNITNFKAGTAQLGRSYRHAANVTTARPAGRVSVWSSRRSDSSSSRAPRRSTCEYLTGPTRLRRYRMG